MRTKKLKVILFVFVLLIIVILAGYSLRIDRFGLSQISWIDCLQINGTKYESDFKRMQIDISLVGKQIGIVKFNVSENVHNPDYRFRNGDATFLSVGTKIYQLKATDSNNSVAVKIDDQYYLYTYRE